MMAPVRSPENLILQEKTGVHGAWTVTRIALPMACGLSQTEVAGQVGETMTWVKHRLNALRAELERLSDH